MTIKPGDYIKNFNQKVEYALILDVIKNNIQAIVFSGTPFSDKTIINYSDILDGGYAVELLNNGDVKCSTVYEPYTDNHRKSYCEKAIKYSWQDKELIIPLKSIYFKGYEWAKIPEGFYA